MLTNLLHRSAVCPAILLTALFAGCGNDAAPKPEARSTQVSPKKEDKPAADKPAPSAAAAASSPAAPPAKPAPDAASAAASASAAPALSVAAAASAAPAAAPEPSLDCDKLLEPDDVFKACKVKVEIPADGPKENIGSTEMRCTRRFSSKDAGLLTLIVVRHGSDTEAQERYRTDFKVELSKPDVVPGAGDFARFFLKKGVSGDPILTAEAVKGRFNVTVFNPKVTVGGQTVGPVCEAEGLGKVLVQALGRIP